MRGFDVKEGAPVNMPTIATADCGDPMPMRPTPGAGLDECLILVSGLKEVS